MGIAWTYWNRIELRGSAFRAHIRSNCERIIVTVVKACWKCVSPLMRSAVGGFVPSDLYDFHESAVTSPKILWNLWYKMLGIISGAHCIQLSPKKKSGYFNGSFVPMLKSMVKLSLLEFSDFTGCFSPVIKVLCNRVGPRQLISSS